MPRQVISEVSEITHPDTPGAWAAGVRDLLQHPLNTSWDSMARVMEVAGGLVDPNSPGDPADPWVAALALDLRDSRFDPCCVTEDEVDRRPRISLVTACNRLDLPSCGLIEFLADLQILRVRETDAPS